MNLQRSLFIQLMLYEIELVHNTVEQNKNICCVKIEGAVYSRTETKRFALIPKAVRR